MRNDLEPSPRALLDIWVICLGALAEIPVLLLILRLRVPLDVDWRRRLHYEWRGIDRIGVDVRERIPEGNPDTDADEDAAAMVMTPGVTRHHARHQQSDRHKQPDREWAVSGPFHSLPSLPRPPAAAPESGAA